MEEAEKDFTLRGLLKLINEIELESWVDTAEFRIRQVFGDHARETLSFKSFKAGYIHERFIQKSVFNGQLNVDLSYNTIFTELIEKWIERDNQKGVTAIPTHLETTRRRGLWDKIKEFTLDWPIPLTPKSIAFMAVLIGLGWTFGTLYTNNERNVERSAYLEDNKYLRIDTADINALNRIYFVRYQTLFNEKHLHDSLYHSKPDSSKQTPKTGIRPQ